MNPIMLTIVAFAVIVGSTAVAASKLSPEQITADIEARGPNAVVSHLLESGDYDRVLERIDTGADAWVALGPKLAPGTDAASAEELTISLAYALPKNARVVLSALDSESKIISPEAVCGVPFIEGTVRDIPAYVRRAKAAVSAVTGDTLRSKKAACLAALKKP
jgi:hypothetical protein